MNNMKKNEYMLLNEDMNSYDGAKIYLENMQTIMAKCEATVESLKQTPSYPLLLDFVVCFHGFTYAMRGFLAAARVHKGDLHFVQTVMHEFFEVYVNTNDRLGSLFVPVTQVVIDHIQVFRPYASYIKHMLRIIKEYIVDFEKTRMDYVKKE